MSKAGSPARPCAVAKVGQGSRQRGRRRLQPRQVEGVMVLAADEMYHAVCALADRQVTPRLGAVGAQRERPPIRRFDFAARTVIGDQTACGPGLTLIEGERRVNTRDGT